ncbi:MAG: LytTR family transcriptional regulator [Acholeplasmataceae bacterium]|nr:LytTR family transcriptional regulator [Acholeplasmataceae bacterium]
MIKIIWSKDELSTLEKQLHNNQVNYVVSNQLDDLPEHMVGIEIDDQKVDDLKKVIELIEYEKMQMFFPTVDGFVQLYISNIYYIEAFGEDIVCHMKQLNKQHIKKPLYQLEVLLKPYHFVRISKSFIVNLRSIKYIKVGLNAKLHLTLYNHDQLEVTRSFVKAFKKQLNL